MMTGSIHAPPFVGLHAAIRVMDEAAWRWAMCHDCHLQGRDGKISPQIRLHGPSDHAPAARIEHHRQVRKLLQ
jgi:hypothetical protein